jgi:hypothetical protein
MIWVMPYGGITYANYYNALHTLDQETGHAPGGQNGRGPTV